MTNSDKKSLTKISHKVLVGTAAVGGVLGGLVLSNANVTVAKAAPQTTETAKTKAVAKQKAQLKKNAYTYNAKGKRVGKKALKKNKKINVYGTEIIKGKKYYSLGNGKYVKAGSVKLAKTVTVTKKTRMYNSKGKKVGKKTFKAGKSVATYGTKKIKGKKYYSLGNCKYIPASKTEAATPAFEPASSDPAKPDNQPADNNQPAVPNNGGAATGSGNTGSTTMPSQPSGNGDNSSASNDEFLGKSGDCYVTYNKSTGTVHIKPGETGNKYGNAIFATQILPSGNIDTSDIKSIVLDAPITFLGNASEIFMKLPNLMEIKGLDKVDTTNVTDMHQMFAFDPKLKSLDVSNFDTSNVTNMASMFHNDASLTSLDISSFDTSKVMDMSYMFAYTTSLKTLRTASGVDSLGNANTNKDNMFYGSHFQNAGATTPNQPSNGDNNSGTTTPSKPDNGDNNTDSTTPSDNLGTYLGQDGDCELRFNPATKTLHIQASDKGNVYGGDPIYLILKKEGISPSDVHHISIDSKISFSEKARAIFKDLDNLTDIQGLNKVDTSKATDMSFMFSGDQNLKSLDLSKFDTSKVTDMSGMFYMSPIDSTSSAKPVGHLTNLDLSNFDTSKVTDMSGMFYGNTSLQNLNISSFDTSKVTDMSFMFSFDHTLKSLDVSKFNTSKVTDMSYMFLGYKASTNLDLSNFDTSQVTNMSHMFEDNINVTAIDVRSFDTSKVTNMSYMFSNAQKVTILDIGNFDTSKVMDMSYMFVNMISLKTLNTGSVDVDSLGNADTNKDHMFGII
ncbi:BspA family leucine-rich repeat surface protein [Lactobacillus sp. ESL0681]|uniref:BspA family leucine-rich repeat surface protein n=1 Tax=Lactobacillus sp. ESL0681 TaxID=2983211 RepID=UPI0023FA055D|nr:BspA family leucine-rich repeat surface protein [Lactobacillus sp. ESL0681]WEV39670.1 BspA family leucine-rich repeat surface protein [Lactobacillus sp. ESL0681]